MVCQRSLLGRIGWFGSRVVMTLALLLAPLSIIPAAQAAGLITVNTLTDEINSDGDCSLREALQAATTDAGVDACPAGSGADTITFAPALAGGTLSLSIIGDTTLGPTAFGIINNVSIVGDATHGLIIERHASAPEMRLFYVSESGVLSLKYLTLRGGVARGFDGGWAFNGGAGGGAAGVGGAIFNSGELSLDSVTLLNNQAIGGNGGSWRYLGAYEMFYGGGGGGVNSAGEDGVFRGSGGGLPNGGNWATPSNNATGPGGGGGGGGQNNTTHLLAGRGDDFGGGGGGTFPHHGGLGGIGGGGGGGGAGQEGFAPGGLGGWSLHGGGDGGRGIWYVDGSIPTHGAGAGGGGAGLGGALYNDWNGWVSVINSTLTANTARGGNGGPNLGYNGLYAGSGGSGFGGGIFNTSALTLINVTLAANTVQGGSGGAATNPGANGDQNGSEVYTVWVIDDAPTVNAINTIMDTSSSAYDSFYNYNSTIGGSHNFVRRASGIPAGAILSSADPRLLALADNGGPTPTMALATDSPAINAGTNSGTPLFDQRGAGRDELPDIGAYEVVGSEWLVDSAADSVAIDGETTLREAIHRANGAVGPHLIRFAPSLAGQTIHLTTAEDNTFGPSAFRIDYPVMINATGVNGVVIQRDAAVTNMRLFYVAPTGNLTLKSVTLSNGLARGGNGGGGFSGGGGAAGLGGAILNQGAVNLDSVTLTGNQAIGGAGGTGVGCIGGGGAGGGGLAENGVDSGGMEGTAGGGPNGGVGGHPGAVTGSAGGTGGGGGGGMSWWEGYLDYSGYDGGAGGFGGGGGGGGCGTSAYPKGSGGPGGFGGGAGGNSINNYTLVNGGFGGGGNGTFGSGGGGAGLGGALFNHGGSLSIVNSTLSDNTAQGGAGYLSGRGLGGAVFNRAGSVTVLNSTLAFNTVAGPATNEGGALYSYADGGTATVSVVNSILSNSSGGSDAVNDGGSIAGSHNVIMSHSGLDSVVLSSTDPNLGALTDNGGATPTHALVPPSSTLHNGTSSGTPIIDQRGIPRDTRPDIGAYELQATVTFADPAGNCAGNIPCFTTIIGAYGGVLAGGTVIVYNGTYGESISLNRNVTVNLNGAVTLNGSLAISAGILNGGPGTLTVTGDVDQSGGTFTTPGGALIINGHSARSGGTLNYTANGTIQETRLVSGLPSLSFPFTEVNIDVTGNTNLSNLLVVRHEQDHAGATRMTGKYWTITPTGSGEVTLTLPQSALADPKVCRYIGGAGNGWDCARDGFDSSVVWRSGITAFSDWAVGDHVGPTAISLADFTAQAAGAATPIGWITLFGLSLIAALLVAYQRK